MTDQVIFRLTFPFTQTEALLDFIAMRRRDVAARMEAADTVAVLRGARSEDGVLGALEIQLTELHDSMLHTDYGSGTCGVVMARPLHSWLVDAMATECRRHADASHTYTGFACTEKHLWEQLTNLVSEFVAYEGNASDTRLVQDDPGFDRLLEEVA